MNKKPWFLSLFLATTGSALASYPACVDELPMQTYMNCEKGALTPPASPITEGAHAILMVDFLWWTARENLLEYAFNVNSTTYPLTLEGVSGTSWLGTSPKEPDFDWAPGFRLGLGYRLPNDFWEAKARWTRFHPEASGSSTATGTNLNSVVYADSYTWADGTGTTPVTAEWELMYDLVEIGLSRSFFLGKNLSLDLQFGAAGAWIDQNYNMTAPNLENQAGVAINTFNLNFTNNFQAGGLFLSMAPQWNAWKRFSVLGSMSAYILHGGFDIDQKWYNTVTSSNDMTISKDYSRTRSGLNGKLGIQWETCPLRRNYHIALAVAYEGTIWFKQNLLSETITYYFENFERRGDLEMQGITFSARADF